MPIVQNNVQCGAPFPMCNYFGMKIWIYTWSCELNDLWLLKFIILLAPYAPVLILFHEKVIDAKRYIEYYIKSCDLTKWHTESCFDSTPIKIHVSEEI
jgi:hypothetical protein